MARDRLQLEKNLKEVLGSSNVYYNPPASIQMSYPCIKYELEDILHEHSNNRVYIRNQRYGATLIDPRPDSPLVEKIDELEYCSMGRSYKADNLWHFTFTIFF